MEILLFLILGFICLYVYFFPTIMANKRNHNNKTPIFIVNLFLGWMLFGWVGALVWAFTDNIEVKINK